MASPFFAPLKLAFFVALVATTWLGCDDGDPRVTWLYEQTRGPVGVRLTAEPRVAQVVTVAITGSQWADAMRSMLDRAGGWARFDVPGLSLRLVLTRADL